MRLPSTFNQRTPFRFNITPMIDVVFLLIIFFLMASYFVRSEQSRPVALPDAKQGATDDQASQNRLTITVEQDGRYSIGGQILPEATVFRRIQELTGMPDKNGNNDASPEVRIRSDKDARFVEIRKIIEQCAAQNIRSIKFAVATRNP
ncbi:MAG: biopolymer transporter ExbD [Planctomycetota bacterium]|jgi:biopolymer transport protein ExbD|nr:MAG: biopolymer transporter ExbD [Planctomycetota bacterium]